jgi:hypothetical protein
VVNAMVHNADALKRQVSEPQDGIRCRLAEVPVGVQLLAVSVHYRELTPRVCECCLGLRGLICSTYLYGGLNRTRMIMIHPGC